MLVEITKTEKKLDNGCFHLDLVTRVLEAAPQKFYTK